ncbi:MAG: hypothetical protein ACRDPE_23675 [Solirubrobacterales bacterium]
MPRFAYDAAQVRILQREGQVVPVAEVDWSDAGRALEEEPVEGFAIVPADKVAVHRNEPFATREAAEVELREIREWPEPSERDAAEAIPWPQPAE